MSKQKTAQPRYMVSAFDEPGAPGAVRFTFVPQSHQETMNGGSLAVGSLPIFPRCDGLRRNVS